MQASPQLDIQVSSIIAELYIEDWIIEYYPPIRKGRQNSGGLCPSSYQKRHLPPWVLFRQKQGLLPGSDMGVNLRRRDGAVSQQRLDVPDIHPRLQQRCGERVAEHMGRYVIRLANPAQILADNPPDRLRGEGPPTPVE